MGEIQAFIRSFHHKLSLRVIIVKENKFPFIGIFQLGKKEEKKMKEQEYHYCSP